MCTTNPQILTGYHRQPQKSGAKIHFSNRHPQSPRHQRTLVIQLIYSCSSRDQFPTNSVAPSSVYKAYTTHNSSICSDEGLTLETSAFQSLYGGQFTLSTPLINQIFVFHSPTDAAPQFLQKLTPFTSTSKDWAPQKPHPIPWHIPT